VLVSYSKLMVTLTWQVFIRQIIYTFLDEKVALCRKDGKEKGGLHALLHFYSVYRVQEE